MAKPTTSVGQTFASFSLQVSYLMTGHRYVSSFDMATEREIVKSIDTIKNELNNNMSFLFGLDRCHRIR